ncbi:MAG: VCBS repeat-containing protein [Deltaproteobacteria bacterium]|nr:VCBS repeat-containing protein [Deltaproteobacteria bacterium]
MSSFSRPLLFLVLLPCLVPNLARGQGAPSGPLGPTAVTLPSGPGSIEGLADSASPDLFSGQVSYSVPIRVPTKGGLSPSLSLDYEGTLGNGPIGVGWALRLPTIRRSLQEGVPTFSDADELVIDGLVSGRLVPIGNEEYRVEGKAHAIRVRRVDSRFVVTDENGVNYVLGATSQGRLGPPARTAAWFVETVLNNAGERVDFTYEHDRGQVYLATVSWGPNKVYRLFFSYEDRPDDVVSLKTGSRVVTARRLRDVRVKSFGDDIAVTHLGYEETGPLSRLGSVRVTGRGGRGEMPVLRFSYATPGAARVVGLPGTSGWVLGQRGVTLFDVDGDGMSDLCRLEMGNHGYRKNLGGRFSAEAPLTGAADVELESSRFLDLDGDARPELVRVIDDTWRAYRLAGTKWVPMGVVPGTRGLPLAENDGAVLADLDGDGRTDVLRATASGLLVNLAARSAMGPAFGAPKASAVDSAAFPGAASVRILDYNGDDLADMVWLTDAWMKVFLGRGDGTFEAWDRVFYPWGNGGFNLDEVTLADLNRDGLMDLVRVTSGHVLYYPGLGSHRFQAVPRHVARPEVDGPFSDVVVTISDVNGNGSEDLVWSSPRGMWALDLAGPTSAGMLSAIDNGLGQVTSFTYGASGLLAQEAEQAGRPWVRKLPVSIPVPVRMDVTFADGTPTRTVHQGVRDGFWDGEERRFGGFLEGRRAFSGTTGATTRYEETRYHPGIGQERLLRGVPWHARVEDGQGAVFSVVESDYSALPVAGLPDVALLRRAAMKEKRSHVFDGAKKPIESRAVFRHDSEGRPVEETDYGRMDLDGDERVTRRTFASDETTWVRDRLIEETLSKPDGTLVSRQRFFFGDERGEYSWGTVGKGWPAATEGLLVEPAGSRWVRLSETLYDGRGNPTRVTSGGVTREIEHDPLALFPIRETIRPSATSQLSWEITWDRALGKPRTLTDPSGDVAAVTYDELGRVVALSQNGAPAHARFAYAWTAPRPQTISYVFDGDQGLLPGLADAWQQGAPWRQLVTVQNGAGEDLFAATRLLDRWIVSGWKERDNLGRVTALAQPFYWDGASLPVARPAHASVETRSYDALNRVVTKTLSTGAKTIFTYRAFARTMAQDGLSGVTSEHDGWGRVIRTERTVGGVVESVDATYDAAGRILSMRLGEGTAVHSFGYDTLGRLNTAHDPDIGSRTLEYNDAGRLVRQTNGAGQVIDFQYDGAGRVLRRSAGDGTSFEYHYDVNANGNAAGHVRGRLGWILEPTGRVEFSYDPFGRRVQAVRTIDGVTAAEELTMSPSGLVLRKSHDDGFALDLGYDAAGRLVRAGTLWETLEQDAAGRVLRERLGNDVHGVFEQDALGLVSRVTARRAPGSGIATTLYDVELFRNEYGAVVRAVDHDGVGLDQDATFTYDGAARLVDATIGTGPSGFRFSYQYDGLQNMTERTAAGPRELGLFAGTHVYGESGAGPRQLTSVLSPSGTRRSFSYDRAGRQVQDGDTIMVYNGLDQLVSVVQESTGRRVEYGYGEGGLRTKTIGPGGDVETWFSPELRVHGDQREHYVMVGERLVARVTMSLPSDSTIGGPLIEPAAVARVMLVACTMFLAVVLLGPGRRRHPRWVQASASLCLLVLTTPACGPLGERRSRLTATQTIYFHQGLGAGPVLLTRQDATILEERRYEPFGQPIDAYRQSGGVGSVGEVDVLVEPHNGLNKPTDVTTGWSYHGARWMAPQSARWLTPDPPVKAPDPAFMKKPWDLNPYQYVGQNPVLYWDPDGEKKVPTQPRLTVASDALAIDEDDPIYGVVRKAWSPVTIGVTPLDQFDHGGADACFPTAKKMAVDYVNQKKLKLTLPGKYDVIQVATEEDQDGRAVVDKKRANEAVTQVNDYLTQGIPVLVGVSYAEGDYNEGITDHFVTIYGRGWDEQDRFYFDFYDPGAGGDSFRLYWDPLSGKLFKQGTLEGSYVRYLDYEVTQVRLWEEKK